MDDDSDLPPIISVQKLKHYTGLAASSLPKVKKHDNASWIVHKCRKLLLKLHLNFKTSLLKKSFGKGYLMPKEHFSSHFHYSISKGMLPYCFGAPLSFFQLRSPIWYWHKKVSRQILQGIILKGIIATETFRISYSVQKQTNVLYEVESPPKFLFFCQQIKLTIAG